MDAAAARFAAEQPEVAQITGEAFKVKIVEQGNEAIVIKLSDPEAGAPLQEGAPATAVEEACSRSGPSYCNEVHQRMAEQIPHRGHACNTAIRMDALCSSTAVGRDACTAGCNF